jgi:hypothetical protein
MKCNHCGIKIDVCQYGNPECQQKDTHWYCKTPSCGRGNVGLGCPDPCWSIKIKNNWDNFGDKPSKNGIGF